MGSRRVLVRRASWLALFFSSVNVGQADQWPSFRGPNGSGIGSGSPPARWDVDSGENIRWKTPVPGLGHASPVVWNDRVWVTTAISSGPEEPELKTGWIGGSGDPAKEENPWTWRVLCFDARNGRLVWERDACTGVPKVKRHAKASHANCTPATDGRHIVAFFGSEGLYCYSMDGELRWKQDLGTLDAGPWNAPRLQWGVASSPILHDGLVILQCDANNESFWVAFDVETGKEIRRVERRDVTTWSTPTVVAHMNRVQLVCNGWKQMAGYDLATGEMLWTLSGGGDIPVPTPQFAHGLIFLTNGHGRSPVYAIRADARGDVKPGDAGLPDGVAWWHAKGGAYMPTPIVVGDLLYVANDSGVLAALDARTGVERYRERLSTSGATFSASPVSADGRLYLTAEDGTIFVVNAGDSFELLAKNAMNEICMATPAIADGAMFVRTRSHVYCIAR